MNRQESKSELSKVLGQTKGAFISVGIFSLFINLLMLTSPLYMLQLYDRVLMSRSESTLVGITVIVVFLFTIMGILEFIRSRVLIRIGSRMEEGLNQKVFDGAMMLSLANPNHNSTQPLRDLTTVRQYMTGGGLFAFFDSPWVPIYLAILYLFHPFYGMFALGAAVILIMLALINEWTTKSLLSDANSESIKSFGAAASHQRNAEVVHAMGMQANLRKRWLKVHNIFLNLQAKASDKSGVWSNTSKTFRVMAQSLMLGLGGYLVIQAELSPGMMIAGSIIMGRALAPIDLMINGWKGFSETRSAYGRLAELLDISGDDEDRMSLPSPVGNMQLKGVIAAPPGSKEPVLKGIEFGLSKGTVLGVIGPSAAGKSSLARVLLGLWPLRSGEVRLDGVDVTQWPRDELGPYLGYLPQDIELFNGSVSDNIARFGKIDPEQVVAAARLAGVHEMILKLPEGYDTVIGQAGGVLSGGQRQRIGLARAVYGNPVLVVLDEPNSNLDEIGEAALIAAIAELKKRKVTVVLITHRASILGVVDQLLMLSEGQVVAVGPRDEVLKKLSQAKAQAQAPQKKNIPAPMTIPVGG